MFVIADLITRSPITNTLLSMSQLHYYVFLLQNVDQVIMEKIVHKFAIVITGHLVPMLMGIVLVLQVYYDFTVLLIL